MGKMEKREEMEVSLEDHDQHLYFSLFHHELHAFVSFLLFPIITLLPLSANSEESSGYFGLLNLVHHLYLPSGLVD